MSRKAKGGMPRQGGKKTDAGGKGTVLLTGADGFLGKKIASVFSAAGYELIKTSHRKKPGYSALDMKDSAGIRKLIAGKRPEVVIHTAANKDNDYCELHREEAYAINVGGTMNVAEACRETGAKMVFISTEYIFDGTKKGEYGESDGYSPVNYYGETKALAEQEVKKKAGEFLIIRPGILYGFNGLGQAGNYVWFALNEMRQGREVAGFSDQFCCPALADDVADAILRLLEKGRTGIYNVTGGECLSRLEFLRKGAKVFGFDVELVKASGWRESGRIARKPERIVLSVEKLKNEGIKTHNVREGFEIMKRQIPEGWFW